MNVINRLSKFDKRIKVFKNERNIGLGANWNKAVEQCTGDYIMLFNGDDILNHAFVEKALSVLQNDNVDLVTSSFGIVNEVNAEKIYANHDIDSGLINEFFSFNFLRGCPFLQQFTLYKRLILQKLRQENGGVLYENRPTCDSELWYRIGRHNFNVYYLNEIGGYHLRHSRNTSSNYLKMINSQILDLKKHHVFYSQSLKGHYRRIIERKCFEILKHFVKTRNFLLLNYAFEAYKLAKAR